MSYKTLKRYYDKGFYTDEDMKVFVDISWLSAEEYKTITKVEYK